MPKNTPNYGTPIRSRFINDAAGIAHWIGRKFNNHAPARDKVGTPTEVGKLRDTLVFVAGTDQQALVYSLADGRQFLVEVRELTASEQETISARGTEKFVHA